LPFAEPASPLERRIRAMTDRRPKLSLMRRLTISAIVCVAVVAACEARRPEPLAPVTTFSVHNAKSNQRTELTQTQKDARARALSAEIATRVPDSSLVGDPNDPLLIVYSSTGRLLLAKRLSKNEGGVSDIPINSNAIATVDVAKGEAVEKRPETKGGVIRIVFKPGAENAGDTWKGSTGKMRVGMDASANPENSRTASGKPSLDSATVYVYDSFGKEIVEQKGSSAASTLVDADQIARMDVQKEGPNDTAPAIRIYLKPGATLKKQW
ncbi:MAG: hypothetical protein ABIT38_14870, partial [Gemmatimonadaceae bacterium]